MQRSESMAYDVQVRKAFNEAGIDNSRIGFDDQNKTVTVDNQYTFKPGRIYNGTSFADQGSIDNFLRNFQLQRQATTQPTTTRQVAAPPQPQQPNYQSQYTQLLDSLYNQMNIPQQSFDPYSTERYAAAQAQQQRAAQQGIRSAQEALGSSGFGRSRALGESAQNIQNNANEYLMTQVVPQIVAENESRRQQELQNQYQLLNTLMSADQTQYERQRQQGLDQFNQDQQNWENRLRYGQVIGQFENGQRPYDVVADQRNFEYQQQQDQIAQQNLQEEKAYRRQRDSEEDRQWWANYERAGQQFAQQMGYNWAQLGQREREHLADQAYKQQRLALDTRQEDRLSSQANGVTSPKVDSKTSYDNYDYVKSQLDSSTGTAAQKKAYIQSIKDQLTDSDYRKLLDHINQPPSLYGG